LCSTAKGCRQWQKWVKGGGAEGVGSWSAYPPRLSVIADIPALTLCADIVAKVPNSSALIFLLQKNQTDDR
jgi:hypothetical protein